MSEKKRTYSSEDIERLSDREHVRRRPAMYFGGLDDFGRLNLLKTVLSDALTQALVDEVKQVWIRVDEDGVWSIANDGNGISVRENPLASRENGRSTSIMESATSCLRYGNYARDRYLGQLSWIGGVGLSAVNFVSESFSVRSKFEGRSYEIRYEKGAVVQSMVELTDCEWQSDSGTLFTFKPDPEIFGDDFIDEQSLVELLPEYACLYPDLTISFFSKASNLQSTYFSRDGVIDLLNGASDPEVLYAVQGPKRTWENGNNLRFEKAEIAFRFCAADAGQIRSFCNGERTLGHGTHVDGFLLGIRNTVHSLAEEFGVSVSDDMDAGVLKRLDAVVSVFLYEPQFEYQRSRLGNLDLVEQFARLTEGAIRTRIEQNPNYASALIMSLS